MDSGGIKPPLRDLPNSMQLYKRPLKPPLPIQIRSPMPQRIHNIFINGLMNTNPLYKHINDVGLVLKKNDSI